MKQTLRSRLVESEGQLQTVGGIAYDGAVFESDGPLMKGSLVVGGEVIGPYISPFLGPTGHHRCLNLSRVVNDATGDQPSSSDTRFRYEGEPFTGIGFDFDPTLEETLWVDGFPIRYISYVGGSVLEFQDDSGPLTQEYSFSGGDGAELSLANAHIRVSPSGAGSLRLKLSATVDHKDVGERYLELASPIRELLLLPELADEHVVAAIPEPGEPYRIDATMLRSMWRH